MRTRQLKELLNTPISGLNAHDTPFSRFDAEIQSEILGLFEQLEGIMTDVYRLVWERYGDGAGHCDIHGDGASAVQRTGTPDSTASPRPPLLKRASSSTTLAKMRWIWRDKKRAEQLLTQFNEMNASIYSHIKLLLLSSTLSRDLEYCHVLERDGNAKALGLDSDVRLCIIAAGERPTAGPHQQQQQQTPSLEIQPWTIAFPDDSCARDSGVSICKHGADDVALEYKSIPAGRDIQETVVARARQLAALLSQHKDPSFRVLQCRGYAHLASKKRFAFLFNLPPGCHPQSVSLLDELRNRRSRPSLGDKFRLALVLASSIAQLQMVQWVSFASRALSSFSLLTHSRRVRSTNPSAAPKSSSSVRPRAAPSRTTSRSSSASSTAGRKTTSRRACKRTTSRTTSTGTRTGRACRRGRSRRCTTSTR